MASKYKAEFDLPKEFPSILKAFTREILRYQPENVYEFGASYFQNLLKEHAAADSGGSKRRLSPQELEQLLRQLFAEHDVDGNGHLDHKEFRALLNSANLGLSPREVKRVLAEADENEDGRIEYTEFIPVAIELVQAMYAKMDLVAEKQEQANAARQAAEAHMLHGMPREALEAIMSDIFRKADLDGSGTLSRKEFNTCLREADLGLKRKEINLIMAEVDTDEDGAPAPGTAGAPHRHAGPPARLCFRVPELTRASPFSARVRVRPCARHDHVRRVRATVLPDPGRNPQG